MANGRTPPRQAAAPRAVRRHYSRQEVLSLIASVEEVVPISAPEWEQVEQQHASRYPEANRSVEQLRKKFHDLARRNIPTGDPNIPVEVREAKRVRALIYQKSDGGTGSVSDGFGVALGPDDNNDVDVEDEELSSINQAEDNRSINDVLDQEAAPVNNRTRARSSSSTPIFNRRPRRSNEDGPSFNQVFLMMMRQQQQDRIDEQERQRRAEAQQQLQLHMHNSMMQTMMMALLGRSNGVEGGINMPLAAGMPNNVAGLGLQSNRPHAGIQPNASNVMEMRREEQIQAPSGDDPEISREESEERYFEADGDEDSE